MKNLDINRPEVDKSRVKDKPLNAPSPEENCLLVLLAKAELDVIEGRVAPIEDTYDALRTEMAESNRI